MNNIVEENTVTALDELRLKANQQIEKLNLQSSELKTRSSYLQSLIKTQLKEQSLLGQVAYWYGEKNWFLKLVISISVACLATLISIPLIISMALSLIVFYLLIDYHSVCKEQHSLVYENLEKQNKLVENMLQFLQNIALDLNKSLNVLCEMNENFRLENEKLSQQIAIFTEQINQSEALNQELQKIIDDLKHQAALNDLKMSEQLKEFTDTVDSLKRDSLNFGENIKSRTQDYEGLEKLTRALETSLDAVQETSFSEKSSELSQHTLESAKKINEIVKGHVSSNGFFTKLQEEIAKSPIKPRQPTPSL